MLNEFHHRDDIVIELGSDLAEVQNVVDVVYGNMSADVNSFAQSAIKSYGMSETVAKNYMGTLGAMSKAFGFTTQEAYGQAEALTALAGDMASFYNKSTDETFTALKAVYSGESEVLKQYGVVMNETAQEPFIRAKIFSFADKVDRKTTLGKQSSKIEHIICTSYDINL